MNTQTATATKPPARAVKAAAKHVINADVAHGALALKTEAQDMAHGQTGAFTAEETGQTVVINAAKEQLRTIVEHIERLEEEKKSLGADIKDVYGEAKANGFDTKALRKIVSLRKLDRDQRMEEEAMLELYKQVLGMS